MSTRNHLALSILLAIGLLIGSTPRSEAAGTILIFKVTFVGKALFFPKAPPNGNAVKSTGYLIYDAANPANSQTIELFSKTKTYQINGGFLQLIFPSQIAIGALDRNTDGFFETASSLVGFTSGAAVNARAYIGTRPRPPGYKVGGQFFNGPKSLKGKGSVTVAGQDHFTITDTWTLDPLSGTGAVFNSANSNDGLVQVQAFIEAKGYHL